MLVSSSAWPAAVASVAQFEYQSQRGKHTEIERLHKETEASSIEKDVQEQLDAQNAAEQAELLAEAAEPEEPDDEPPAGPEVPICCSCNEAQLAASAVPDEA